MACEYLRVNLVEHRIVTWRYVIIGHELIRKKRGLIFNMLYQLMFPVATVLGKWIPILPGYTNHSLSLGGRSLQCFVSANRDNLKLEVMEWSIFCVVFSNSKEFKRTYYHTFLGKLKEARICPGVTDWPALGLVNPVLTQEWTLFFSLKRTLFPW